ncbi:MAG: PA14 domain-containing protein [Rhodothermales bacterium]|nr:PA14 domain-containing protein [Rhodothermales bacterium]
MPPVRHFFVFYVVPPLLALTLLIGLSGLSARPAEAQVTVSGELKRWHPITLRMTGPQASEAGAINPFSDYRVDVTFRQGAVTYIVPGYFAADGNARESSATAGDVWLAHFSPPTTGTWSYTVSFVSGTDIAVADDASGGLPVGANGLAGLFVVDASDKTAPDFRGRGILRYIDQPYLRFDDGSWYLKAGTNSPENLLAYADIDGTSSLSTPSFVKSYPSHVADWRAGDPVWKGTKGKGLIGAINYLASEGVNSAFFVFVNLGLRDAEDFGNEDVWPWIAPEIHDRYDVSKLAQWDVLFRHMQQKGLLIHIALQEVDNDLLLDNGELGRNRKLYYREMVARFGYHPAVMWNIGEELLEGRNTDAQRKAYIDYIDALDAYDHPVMAHSFPGTVNYESIYGPLLGHPSFSGISFQIHEGGAYSGDLKVYNNTKLWYTNADNAGKPWVIMMDECCGWKKGIRPWGEDYNVDKVRQEVLWGNLMAGGAGVEWFFGDDALTRYDYKTEDFRPYEEIWRQTRYALDFFHTYLPFPEMTPQTGLTSDENHLVFARPGEVYAVYLRRANAQVALNLEGQTGVYSVKWFNPRLGGAPFFGSVREVSGGGVRALGPAPTMTKDDWVALVQHKPAGASATARFTAFSTDETSFAYSFDASGATSTAGSIASYQWDFGDGVQAYGQTNRHTYARAGYYHPSLSIVTSNGVEDRIGLPIVVLPVPGGAVTGLRAEYFKGTSFTGVPEVRMEPRIAYNWGEGVPIDRLSADNFTVRWTGYIQPEHTETYTFTVGADDGARVWIDGDLVVDTWDAGGYTYTSGSKALQADYMYPLKVELLETTGRTEIALYWASPTTSYRVVDSNRLFFTDNTTLPVSLTRFTALADSQTIHLSWETASETNNAGFDVERSIDGFTFSPIGQVAGSGTTLEPRAYRFADGDAPNGAAVLWYRLRQIDFDGTFAYSEVVSVDRLAPSAYALHENYPNPFNPTTRISYDLPVAGPARLAVYDLLGREVRLLVDAALPAGRHEVTFDAGDLPGGVYMYRLEAGRHAHTRSLILVK